MMWNLFAQRSSGKFLDFWKFENKWTLLYTFSNRHWKKLKECWFLVVDFFAWSSVQLTIQHLNGMCHQSTDSYQPIRNISYCVSWAILNKIRYFCPLLCIKLLCFNNKSNICSCSFINNNNLIMETLFKNNFTNNSCESH